MSRCAKLKNLKIKELKNKIHYINIMSNKYIAVSYKLYTVENGEREFVEEATAERPFQFLIGCGVTFEEVEKQIADLETGADFEF